MYDVIIIGGGVIGGTVLRELTKRERKVCLLEKEDDVCMGQSKANSGIVHAGFDAKEGTNKAKFNVIGNRMMESYAEQLGVKFLRNGSLVVAFSEEELETLRKLKIRGEKNGVPELRIIGKEELRNEEPHVSDLALGALYAPTGGIVNPYELTIAAIGNAMDNGADLKTNFKVVKAEALPSGGYVVYSERGEKVEGKLIIDCAGYESGKVAKLFGDDEVEIGGRKGEYILLDKESGNFVSHTLFFTPTEKGKGILVSPTADGNLLLGPTAEEVPFEDKTTSATGLSDVIRKAGEMCKNVPLKNTITSFTGVRAYSTEHDFVIRESRKAKDLILCVGIESPGLTSAPAIAEYVAEELVQKRLPANINMDFNGNRRSDRFFETLSEEEKNDLIKKEPSYGRIICRCEQVSEGEILHAIRANPPARSIDAIKRRTRAGMGRCQGGFCMPQVAEILAREEGIDLKEITKNGEGSPLVFGVTK